MIKKGFTLAEVLITLGIIGVTAALTVPQLGAKTANAHLGAEYAKAISTLENGIGTFLFENNVKNTTQFTDANYTNLKVSTLFDKLSGEGYIKMKSGSISAGGAPCTSGYFLADKSFICASTDCTLSVHKGNTTCEAAFVSSKSVNQKKIIEGLDYFKMSVSADGLIYVPGADYTPTNNTCTKTGGGGACAGRVAKNGWKFSDAVYD